MPHFTPVTTLGSGVDAIGTGYQHACLIDDRFAYCWGENSSGQAAQAGSIIMTPQLVRNVNDVIGIAGGLFHTCAVQQGGNVRCWGGNGDGQLGIGDTTTPVGPVQAIVAGIVQITAGVNHTCALASGGTVYCWGEGYTSTPTEVQLPALVTQIASGSYHDCFVLAPSLDQPKGSVWCTGANPYGQLGRGGDPGGSLGPGPVALCQ
jgi:alpha-tubulin suppressor-like RCC1 family protein